MDYHREAELCGHSALCGKHTALLLQARLIPIKVHTDFANSDILPGAGTQFRLDFSELRINQFRLGELRRVEPAARNTFVGKRLRNSFMAERSAGVQAGRTMRSTPAAMARRTASAGVSPSAENAAS